MKRSVIASASASARARSNEEKQQAKRSAIV